MALNVGVTLWQLRIKPVYEVLHVLHLSPGAQGVQTQSRTLAPDSVPVEQVHPLRRRYVCQAGEDLCDCNALKLAQCEAGERRVSDR